MNKNIYAENIKDVLITITLEIWEEYYNNLHLTKIIWWNVITPLFGYSLKDVIMESFLTENTLFFFSPCTEELYVATCVDVHQHMCTPWKRWNEWMRNVLYPKPWSEEEK
jgi:hypothetical protein